VLEYRDFLERNRIPFRWIDVDRNPLVRYLGASAALRQRSLPAFLFHDGSSIEAAPGEEDDLAFARTKAFFAGDVRHGSVKRVASAVGEGAVAVQLVHRYLAGQAAA